MHYRKIFFIGGILSNQEVEYCIKNLIDYDMAADNFQKKFIKGFQKDINYINVPFIKYHPLRKFNTAYYSENSKVIKEVKFLNVRYISNIFKYYALKKTIQNINFDNSIIFCYAIHTPFLRIIKNIKKNYKKAKVIQIVPDLPQYMNLESKTTLLYRILKKYDLYTIEKLLKNIDFFVPFTLQMYQDYLIKYKKPFYVMEGIADSELVEKEKKCNHNNKYIILYTGTLNKKYGVYKLIEAFKLLEDDDIELHICGSGELQNFLLNNKFKNIKYLGLLTHKETRSLISKADLLINPREADSVFTKYSFPSKIFEYLSSGNKVLCFKLPGIPQEYDEFLYYFDKNDLRSMANRMKEVVYLTDNKNCSIKFLEKKTAHYHIENILNKISLS